MTIIGLVGLSLISSSVIKRKALVVGFYLLSVSGSFYWMHVKTTESSVPLYLFAARSSISLKLRVDSFYRIMNYAYHMGESWQEGTYSLMGNKITLICKGPVEGNLANELWIRRDTLFYGDAATDKERVEEGYYLEIKK